MSKSRAETWRTLIILAVALPIAAVVGIISYISATTTPLHPKPQDVESVMQSAPLPAWTDAVEQGRRIVQAGLTEQNLPGLSVAVGVGDDIVWAEGFGWANIESRAPVAPDMPFRIGHVSKALTSAGVGLLMEKGRLRLDDEIQTHVPAFPRKQWPVTLRQLMGHVAGVRHYRSEADYTISTHCERASDGLSSFADDPLLFEPQTQYAYSTYGWVLVSAAVEAAAAEPFFTFMGTRIFKPLGMTDTTSDAATGSVPDRATFYDRDFAGRAVPITVDYSCFAGAGAFLSTPSDLVRFGMALNNDTLLQPATVRTLQTPQQLDSGEMTNYGLGWMLDTVTLAGEPTRLVGLASRTPLGASTSFLIFPERGIVVAVMTNMTLANMKSLALPIAETFAERAKSPTPR